MVERDEKAGLDCHKALDRCWTVMIISKLFIKAVLYVNAYYSGVCVIACHNA